MEISLCILVRNEERSLKHTLPPLTPHFAEIVIMDDYSSDDTLGVAKKAPGNIQIYRLKETVRETGFAVAANEMLDRASLDWRLIIDADEGLDRPDLLDQLIRHQDVLVWSLPRRKWGFRRGRAFRTEYEAYPDWQIRLIHKNAEGRFEGQMHVQWAGEKAEKAFRGPHVEHYQEEFRDTHKIGHREKLYKQLSRLQGVRIHGGKPII